MPSAARRHAALSQSPQLTFSTPLAGFREAVTERFRYEIRAQYNHRGKPIAFEASVLTRNSRSLLIRKIETTYLGAARYLTTQARARGDLRGAR